MEFLTVDIVGYIAGFVMSISFIPQAIKSIRTKDTSSISLSTQMLFFTSAALWFIYGILLFNGPMMFWNVITMCVGGAVLIAKLRYG